MSSQSARLLRQLEKVNAPMKRSGHSSHVKIYDPQGRSLVAILPLNGHADGSQRDYRNVVAQLRRAGYQV
jgi:hypothetical protein